MGNNLKLAAGWTGFAGSICTLLVGILTVCFYVDHADLRWYDHLGKRNWWSDLNLQYRLIFGFKPDVILDLWVPMVFGVVGCLAQLTKGPVHCQRLCKNYLIYTIYLTIQGTFGCIGYMSNIGILLSTVTFLGAFVNLVAIFADKNGSPYLAINWF